MSDNRAPAHRNLPEKTTDRLVDEVIVPVGFRRAATVIAGTLLVLVALNIATLWYLDRYTSNSGYWVMKRKWEMLQARTAPADWLIVGDSSCNQGVVPTTWEPIMGGDAVNLCTNAGLTLADGVWMLEEHIRQLGPPSNVLVVHTYDMWPRDIEYVALGKIPLPWGFWRKLKPSPQLSWRQEVDIFLTRYLPLYAENVTLLRMLLQAVATPSSLFDTPWRLDADGYMGLPGASAAGAAKDGQRHIDFVSHSNFTLSDINREALVELARLSDEYGIEVYLANGPLYEGLFETEEFQAYYGAVQDVLREASEQSPTVHYVPHNFAFPLAEMRSADHVAPPAAVTYTKQLAEQVLDLRQSR